MNFKLWLESTQQIDIASLIMDKENAGLAVHSLSQGRSSLTSGPVKVIQTPQGYVLTDGYHRTLQAILSGKDTIAATVETPDYDPYVPPAARRYVYDADDEFYGLEEFATQRILRSIMS